jgi:hypothetical protein
MTGCIVAGLSLSRAAVCVASVSTRLGKRMASATSNISSVAAVCKASAMASRSKPLRNIMITPIVASGPAPGRLFAALLHTATAGVPAPIAMAVAVPAGRDEFALAAAASSSAHFRSDRAGPFSGAVGPGGGMSGGLKVSFVAMAVQTGRPAQACAGRRLAQGATVPGNLGVRCALGHDAMGAGAPVTERATRCSGLNPSIGQGLLRRPAVPSSPVAALSDAAAAHRPDAAEGAQRGRAGRLRVTPKPEWAVGSVSARSFPG